jgi:DNA-binding NtrC family response regulator
VRELKNLAERLVILVDDSKLTADDLHTVIPVSFPKEISPGNPGQSIAKQEADLIISALKKSDNVIARAARMLQITDQSLLRRIKKYGIQLPV